MIVESEFVERFGARIEEVEFRRSVGDSEVVTVYRLAPGPVALPVGAYVEDYSGPTVGHQQSHSHPLSWLWCWLKKPLTSVLGWRREVGVENNQSGPALCDRVQSVAEGPGANVVR